MVKEPLKPICSEQVSFSAEYFTKKKWCVYLTKLYQKFLKNGRFRFAAPSLDDFVCFSKQKHPTDVFKFFYCIRNLWPLFVINIYLFNYRIAVIVNGNHCGGFFIPKAKILTLAFGNKILLNSINNMKARATKTLI